VAPCAFGWVRDFAAAMVPERRPVDLYAALVEVAR
jgi:hypothetical protein